MKNVIITFMLFMASMSSYASNATSLDAKTQRQVIDRVKEYCGLMQEISGDEEKIDKMETLFALCENANVSVFNDLSTSSTKDIYNNSMPLQQYMMLLTDKFGNKVKVSFSGFKYIKLVVQPSPLKEFDAAKYAFIKVDKQVKAQGVNTKQKLNIIVNTATMKVSSTISEDYEDPQRIYLDALEKFNDNNYAAAIPLLSKICNIERYPGRYRAKTMLGWIYAEQKKYQEAYDLLRTSSEADPLGKVILASKILMVNDAPAKFINNTEAGQILQQVSNVKDKEFPTMHLIAKSAIVDAFDLQRITFKFIAFNNQMADELISDPYSTDAFKIRGYFVKGFNSFASKNTIQMKAGIEAMHKAAELLKTAGMTQKDFEHWDLQISAVTQWLAATLGLTEESNQIILNMKQKPYCLGFLGTSLIPAQNYQGAYEMLKQAAEYGDAFAAYVLSISYLPTHTPLTEYETDFIKNTKLVKDEIAVYHWKKFVEYLISTKSQSQKSNEDFLKWNKKAMELGDINAKEDYALFEASGLLSNIKRNIPHALELACSTANLGLRSNGGKIFSTFDFALNYEMDELKIPFEQTQTLKTLKALDEQGNGAASYLLYLVYSFAEDSIQSKVFLKKSAESYFYYGMLSYADDLAEKKQCEEALKWYGKLAIFPNSYIMSRIGDICKEYYHDYKMARENYMIGKDSQKDPVCCERLGDLSKDGLGVKKNPNLAKAYYNLSIQYYKAMEFTEEDDVIINVRNKLKELEGLKVNQANANKVKEMISRLNELLAPNLDEEQRINLSQTLLSEIFASPQAKVKTMDITGKTVVATETAEDFMLRLATIKTGKKVVGLSYKKTKDAKFKLTELTVRMK